MYKKPEFTTASDSEAKTMDNTSFLVAGPGFIVLAIFIILIIKDIPNA